MSVLRDWCRAWFDAMNRARTHSHKHTLFLPSRCTQAFTHCTQERGPTENVREKHAVMTLDFPVLLQQRPSSMGQCSTYCTGTHANTCITSNKSGAERERIKNRGGVTVNEGNMHQGDKKENLPPTQSVTLLPSSPSFLFLLLHVYAYATLCNTFLYRRTNSQNLPFSLIFSF